MGVIPHLPIPEVAVRMKTSLRLLTLAAASVLSLSACTQPGAPSQASTKPAPVLDHDAVGAIRAAGMSMGKDSSVQVQPLRDPAIEGYLNQAHAAETAKNFDGAAAATAEALKLAPEAPDILQYQAEVEMLRGHFKEAEAIAIRSFTLGPKVGSLCARNWQTVVEARLAMNDAPTVAQARQRLKECRVAPPVRM